MAVPAPYLGMNINNIGCLTLMFEVYFLLYIATCSYRSLLKIDHFSETKMSKCDCLQGILFVFFLYETMILLELLKDSDSVCLFPFGKTPPEHRCSLSWSSCDRRQTREYQRIRRQCVRAVGNGEVLLHLC